MTTGTIQLIEFLLVFSFAIASAKVVTAWIFKIAKELIFLNYKMGSDSEMDSALEYLENNDLEYDDDESEETN